MRFQISFLLVSELAYCMVPWHSSDFVALWVPAGSGLTVNEHLPPVKAKTLQLDWHVPHFCCSSSQFTLTLPISQMRKTTICSDNNWQGAGCLCSQLTHFLLSLFCSLKMESSVPSRSNPGWPPLSDRREGIRSYGAPAAFQAL